MQMLDVHVYMMISLYLYKEKGEGGGGSFTFTGGPPTLPPHIVGPTLPGRARLSPSYAAPWRSRRLDNAHAQCRDWSGRQHRSSVNRGARSAEAERHGSTKGPHHPVLVGSDRVNLTNRHCRDPPGPAQSFHSLRLLHKRFPTDSERTAAEAALIPRAPSE